MHQHWSDYDIEQIRSLLTDEQVAVIAALALDLGLPRASDWWGVPPLFEIARALAYTRLCLDFPGISKHRHDADLLLGDNDGAHPARLTRTLARWHAAVRAWRSDRDGQMD